MNKRLTDKHLAELRATWNDCDPMIMALDEIAALKAERDSARELLARLEKELPALSRNVMADCVAEVAAMKAEAERRGWDAFRGAAMAKFMTMAKDGVDVHSYVFRVLANLQAPTLEPPATEAAAKGTP